MTNTNPFHTNVVKMNPTFEKEAACPNLCDLCGKRIGLFPAGESTAGEDSREMTVHPVISSSTSSTLLLAHFNIKVKTGRQITPWHSIRYQWLFPVFCPLSPQCVNLSKTVTQIHKSVNPNTTFYDNCTPVNSTLPAMSIKSLSDGKFWEAILAFISFRTESTGTL